MRNVQRVPIKLGVSNDAAPRNPRVNSGNENDEQRYLELTLHYDYYTINL